MVQARTVTIGVPVYNGAATLRESLECLRDQTYRNIEVIISDNASTDESAAIAQSFVDTDARFRLIRRIENVGPVPNFFSLLEEAHTEFFMWRADDDWSDLDYVEKLVALFDEYPRTRLAASECALVKPNGDVTVVKSFSAPHQRTRVFRIGHMLMRLTPNSIYGLWHRPTLVDILSRTTKAYPFIWAWDHMAMTPVILEEAVSGTNEIRLYAGQLEVQRYSARESAQIMWRMRRVFRQASLAEVRRLRWEWWEKPIITVFILRYANLRVYRFWKTVRRQVRGLLGIDKRAPLE
jgi:glycosyltransferase involved in cell wall biosynthesis